MSTYSIFFTVATWLVPLLFVASISVACGPNCIQSTDEGDTSALDTTCFLPNNQPLILPDINHQTCYDTCITEDPIFPGLEDCTACFTDVNNEMIEIIAPQDRELQKHFTTRIIDSPNYPNAFYPSSTLCMYIVECPPGQILSYSVIDHTLQGRVNGQCVDFLDIITTHNNTRTCGNFSTTANGTSDADPNKLTVVFRTNRNRQNKGFSMVATCVSPDLGDLKGCTRDKPRGIPGPSGRRNDTTQMVSAHNKVISQLWNGVRTQHPDLLARVHFRVNNTLTVNRKTSTDTTANFRRLIEDNANNCNAVVRANACAIQEIVLKKPCDVPPPQVF